MRSVFVAYRRDDNPDLAGRIADLLRVRLPGARVFIDVDSIPIGSNWLAELEREIGASAALIVVIGERWLATDAGGRTRLADPDDVAARELRLARAHGIEVIPVLAPGARIPAPAELPADLGWLPGQQALVLNRSSPFAAQLEPLCVRLEHRLGPRPRPSLPTPVLPQPAPKPPSGAGRGVAVAVGVVALTLVLLAGGVLLVLDRLGVGLPWTTSTLTGSWPAKGTIHQVALRVTGVTRSGDRLSLEVELDNRSTSDFSFQPWGGCTGNDNARQAYDCDVFSPDWDRTVQAGRQLQMEVGLTGRAVEASSELTVKFSGGPDGFHIETVTVTVPIPQG